MQNRHVPLIVGKRSQRPPQIAFASRISVRLEPCKLWVELDISLASFRIVENRISHTCEQIRLRIQNLLQVSML